MWFIFLAIIALAFVFTNIRIIPQASQFVIERLEV